MFFAPKEIKKETGESLVYNPHRTMVSKELLLMLLTISLIMKANANHFMVIPIIFRLQLVVTWMNVA